MNQDLATLVSVLHQEKDLARALVEVLQADQRRVLEQDIAGLEKSNAQKEHLVLRFQMLEQARREASLRLATGVGIPPQELRVSVLCERLGPEGSALLDAAENLRAVIGSLDELVKVGRGFLEQSILGIRGLLGLLQSLRTPSPQTYDSTGRYAPQQSAAPVAVRREV